MIHTNEFQTDDSTHKVNFMKKFCSNFLRAEITFRELLSNLTNF